MSSASKLKRRLAILLLAGAVTSAWAQGTVAFDNRRLLDSTKLVRMHHFDPVVWKFVEVPVASGLDEGEVFVAQLFVLQGGFEVPVGAPANFRIATTTSPGTWVGGSRTIPGAIIGEPVQLLVKAWDARAESAEAAEQCNLLHGTSAAFTYVPPAENAPPDQFRMTNFSGFTLVRREYAPHTTVEVDENGAAAIGPPDLFHPEGNATMTADKWHSLLLAADWTAAGAVVSRSGGLEYQAPSNRYGDLIVNVRQCDECGHCAMVPLVKVSIRPSPRRPYLALVGMGGTYELVLHGRAGHNYRVTYSTDLRTWSQSSETVAGDWGEVRLESVLVQPGSRWFSFIELGQ